MPLRRQSLARLYVLLSITVLIFTISPLHGQTPTTLYTFTGGMDGKYPQAALIRDSAGNLYGTAIRGGAFNSGVVFKLDKTGKADGSIQLHRRRRWQRTLYRCDSRFGGQPLRHH